MKRFFSLACMAIVAIVASVFTSCSKSDGDSFVASALCVVYGFDDTIFDNYDLKFTYTDENGKTVTEDITKDKSEATTYEVKNLDGTVSKTLKYYQWSKAIIFNKSLTSGESYVTATPKAGSSIFTDETSYTYVVAMGHAAVKATETGHGVSTTVFSGTVKGTGLDTPVQRRMSSTKMTYTVTSDGLTVKE